MNLKAGILWGFVAVTIITIISFNGGPLESLFGALILNYCGAGIMALFIWFNCTLSEGRGDETLET